MVFMIRGALVEYKNDILGPIPNAIIFQFNPETLSRNIQIPPYRTSKTSRSPESNQAGLSPVEKISFTAEFSAADQLNENNVLARSFGIGPQLAALEKMARPVDESSSIMEQTIDAIGECITSSEKEATIPIPRVSYPRILFIWGVTRILPVIIESMSIKEQQYDANLNPIQAKVSLDLAVIQVDETSNDSIAVGATKYSALAKDFQASANLLVTASQITDLIPF